jgi:hypothetical protein
LAPGTPKCFNSSYEAYEDLFSPLLGTTHSTTGFFSLDYLCIINDFSTNTRRDVLFAVGLSLYVFSTNSRRNKNVEKK